MRVKGEGPLDAEWAVIGEGPGESEDRTGRPFQGKTGRELRRLFDVEGLPDFEETFRTNIYREWGGKDYEYSAEDYERDVPELLEELRKVQPQTIVAVGRHAARFFLGDVSLDETHSLPWFLSKDSPAAECFKGLPPVVFVTYHPAAGFRSPEASALVSYGFQQLALYAKGGLKPRTLYDDPYPNPQYFRVTNPSVLDTFRLLRIPVLAFDSEGSARKPWSIQWSRTPGTGYLARAENTDVISAFLAWITSPEVREAGTKLSFHSALHDRNVLRAFARLCGWSEKRILFDLDTLPFSDTMVQAYLLQLEPQGLKGLCTRHANMAMKSFDEITERPHNAKMMGWLQMMWDLCQFDYEEEQEREFARINSTPLRDKEGKVRKTKDGEVRYRKTTKLPSLPKSDLFKSIERCMRSKTPSKLWGDQTEDIRVAGYAVAGDAPERSLSYVDEKEALHYGCRDVDGPTRIQPELEARIDAMGLRDVYNLELGTYPLIDRMMRVGMKPDLKVFSRLSEKLAGSIADLQVRIETVTGREGFNANSGDQVAAYLFGTLSLPSIKMTDSGSRESTNDKILEALEKEHGHEHPVILDLREYRELFKLKGTFCVAPQTRILTRNLTWLRAEDVREGSVLLGFDEETKRGRDNDHHRHWRPSHVLKARRIKRPCYRLKFSDGTTIVCTGEHKWLARSTSSFEKAVWVRTDQLCMEDRPKHTRHPWEVIKLIDVWSRDESFDCGWLSGLYDGEGSLQRPKYSMRLTLSQNIGEVLTCARALLDGYNFPVNEDGRKKNHKLHIGQTREVFRALGIIRPIRLLKKFRELVDTDRLPRAKMSTTVAVVSREFLGEREVIALETSTHTFVAEGLASHNCDRIPDFVARFPHDGRIHTTFRTTRVITGRLSASDPNILAQPEHGKYAKEFKRGWIAEDGHVVCNWDLSQVELRVLAHLSEDPVLLAAYTFRCRHERDWVGGKTICKRDECVLVGDLHAKLAHQVFGVKPSNQDDSRHRLPAKTHNFGLAMGMTCHGLMIELRKNGVEVDEDGAQEWIDASNKLYKRVPVYKTHKIAEARRNGFVRCLSGRIRYIGGIRSSDERLRAEAERFAFSTPIQEGASKAMKEAETYIWDELLMKKYYRDGWYMGGPRGRWVEPLVQVHDALKFEVAEGLERELHSEMSYAMTKVPTALKVPLGVEGKWGRNFSEMVRF